MLTIRAEQLAVLISHSLRQFEGQMVQHIAKAFPERYCALGDEGVRELIRRGIDRASRYDIGIHRDICRYIDLMIVFGDDFDSDPSLPWASEILTDADISDPTTRIERLWSEADWQLQGA